MCVFVCLFKACVYVCLCGWVFIYAVYKKNNIIRLNKVFFNSQLPPVSQTNSFLSFRVFVLRKVCRLKAILHIYT